MTANEKLIEEAWWQAMEAGELPRPRNDGTARQLFEAGYRAAIEASEKAHNPTDDEREALCDQCGEAFSEHSCRPISSCIHLPAPLRDREQQWEPSEAQVEAAARALGNLHSLDWSYMSEFDRNWERGDARAALLAAGGVA